MRNPHQTEYVSDIETIGQRIRRERLERSLTQRQLAEKVGVGVPHISKVEAGRESPSDELIGKIADEFGVDKDELLIAARRVPDELIEKLASDPSASLEMLRTWKTER